MTDTFQRFSGTIDITPQAIDNLVRKIDYNGDGKISFDELTAFLPKFLAHHGMVTKNPTQKKQNPVLKGARENDKKSFLNFHPLKLK